MNTVHLCGEAKDAVAKHQEHISHVRLCMWALIGSSALHVSPRCMKKKHVLRQIATLVHGSDMHHRKSNNSGQQICVHVTGVSILLQ